MRPNKGIGAISTVSLEHCQNTVIGAMSMNHFCPNQKTNVRNENGAADYGTKEEHDAPSSKECVEAVSYGFGAYRGWDLQLPDVLFSSARLTIDRLAISPGTARRRIVNSSTQGFSYRCFLRYELCDCFHNIIHPTSTSRGFQTGDSSLVMTVDAPAPARLCIARLYSFRNRKSSTVSAHCGFAAA